MSFNFSAKMNPELQRILRASYSWRRVLIIAAITFIVVNVITFAVWSEASSKAHIYSGVNPASVGESLYSIFSFLLFATLFVAAPAITSLSLVQERTRDTYIFQQMNLLSPFKLVIGKLIGSTLGCYLVAAIIFPYWLYALRLAKRSDEQIVFDIGFGVVGGLCLQTVGLFVSSVLTGQSERALRGSIFIGPAVGFLGLVVGYWTLIEYRGYSFDNYIWKGDLGFFGLKLNAVVLLVVIFAFVGLWAFIGSVRQIKISQLMPVSPITVWLFLITAEIMLCGLLFGYSLQLEMSDSVTPPAEKITIYLIVNWVILMILAGSFALNRERLREWLSAGDDPMLVYQRNEIRNRFKTFAIALGVAEIGLVALWISYYQNSPFASSGFNVTMQLIPIAVGFALTIIGLAAFIQFCALYKFRLKAWAGVAFIILFFIVTGIIGGVLETINNPFSLANPVSYANQLCKDDPALDVRYYWQHEKHAYVATPRMQVEETARLEKIKTTIPIGLLMQIALLFVGCAALYAKLSKVRDEIFTKQG